MNELEKWGRPSDEAIAAFMRSMMPLVESIAKQASEAVTAFSQRLETSGLIASLQEIYGTPGRRRFQHRSLNLYKIRGRVRG